MFKKGGGAMRELSCLRCGAQMQYMMRERLQLGKTGWILGDLPNLFAGALDADIYVCPDCSKLEFFLAEDAAGQDETPKKTCPYCGKEIDFYYPKCPFCKREFKRLP